MSGHFDLNLDFLCFNIFNSHHTHAKNRKISAKKLVDFCFILVALRKCVELSEFNVFESSTTGPGRCNTVMLEELSQQFCFVEQFKLFDALKFVWR